ncbi:MAG TPA: pyridoxal phosphate-dependent aminotransferase [Gaiellaceae bacterium]|nr:pyridoxal phosphate-dependent aminotransferase [Gaiellaceae bacterium]
MPSREFAERYPDLLAIGGHPSVDMPRHVVEAATQAAERATYAPTRGLPALREAISERIGAELGRRVDPSREVLITLGGMQALHLAAQAFGARTVTHAPSFFFPQIVAGTGGTCTATGGGDGQPDWAAFAAAIGQETTLAIVNTPVNPTGYVFRPHDLDAIAAALADSEALLLSDEAYAGILYDGLPHLSPASHPDLAARTLVLRSFSKTHAMAAWRIGFAVGPPPVIGRMAAALEWQALAVDGVAQAAALAALTGPQEWIAAAVAELAEIRPRAIAAANATTAMRAELPEACAFIWAAIEGEEERWSDLLAREHGITALPGGHFGASTPHLRIPFGGRREAREALLERLAAV